jgi:glutaryl-CoA dehydrogenase
VNPPAKSPPAFEPLDPLGLDDDERAVRDRVADWARRRVAPRIADDFERAYELMPAPGALGVLGTHLRGYGCAGASLARRRWRGRRGRSSAGGIRGAHGVMRHMANLELVLTYEGMHEVHTLTGVRAFA